MTELENSFNAAPTLEQEFNAAKPLSESELAGLARSKQLATGNAPATQADTTSTSDEFGPLTEHELLGGVENAGAMAINALNKSLSVLGLGGEDKVQTDTLQGVSSAVQQEAQGQQAGAPPLATAAAKLATSLPVALPMAAVGSALMPEVAGAGLIARGINALTSGSSAFATQQGLSAPEGQGFAEAGKGAIAGATNVLAPIAPAIAPYLGKVLSALAIGGVTYKQGSSVENAALNTMVTLLLHHTEQAKTEAGAEALGKALPAAMADAINTPEVAKLSETHTITKTYEVPKAGADAAMAKNASSTDGTQYTTEPTADPNIWKVSLWKPQEAVAAAGASELDKFAEKAAYQRKLAVIKAKYNAIGAKPKVKVGPEGVLYPEFGGPALEAPTSPQVDDTLPLPTESYIDASGVIRNLDISRPSAGYKGPEIILPKNAPVNSSQPDAIKLPDTPAPVQPENAFLPKPQQAASLPEAVRPPAIIPSDEGNTVSDRVLPPNLLSRLAAKSQVWIDANKGRVYSSLGGIDPELAYHYSIVGLHKGVELLKAGYTTFNEWASKMRESAPDDNRFEATIPLAWQHLVEDGSVGEQQSALEKFNQFRADQIAAMAGKSVPEKLAQVGRVGRNLLLGNQGSVGKQIMAGEHGQDARLASIAAMNANPIYKSLAVDAIDGPMRRSSIDFTNPDKEAALTNWMLAKRVQEIDSYVHDEDGNPTYMLGKQGTDRTAINQVLNNFENSFDLTSSEGEEIKNTANKIWANFHDLTLGEYLKHGIISLESYLGLAEKGKYYVPLHVDDPRSGLDLFDPDMQVIDKASGNVIGVPGSGMKDLHTGSPDRDPTVDLLPLLRKKIVQAQNIVQRAEAFRELSASAHDGPLAVFKPAVPQTYPTRFGGDGEILNPDVAGKVKRDKFGNVLYEPAPDGMTAVPYPNAEAKQEQFLVSDNIAKDIATMNPAQISFQGRIAGWISSMVKGPITGALNPTFGLMRHLPWSVQTLWAASNAQGLEAYSNQAPIFAMQLGTDIAQVAKQAVTKSGPAWDALKNAGGWQFQDFDYGSASSLSKLAHGMNSLNRTMGVLEYIALYNRLLKQGLSSEEAATRAVDYRSNSYVGIVPKFIDRWTGSYFTPATTALAANLRSMQVDWKGYAWRQAQNIAAVALGRAALIYYQHKHDPTGQVYNQYSDAQQMGGIHTPIGLEITDSTGRPSTYDYYVKTSGVNGVSNILGTWIANKWMISNGYPVRQLTKGAMAEGMAKALADVPNPNFSTMSRLLQMSLTGTDPATGKDMNEGSTPYMPENLQHVSADKVLLNGLPETSPILQKATDNPVGATFNINPMHLQAYLEVLAGPGPFLKPLGGLLDRAVDGLAPDQAKQTWKDIVTQSPTFRMAFTKRDPRQLYKPEVLAAQTAAVVQHEKQYEKFLQLAVGAVKEGPSGPSAVALKSFIAAQPGDDKQAYLAKQQYIQGLSQKGKLLDKEHYAMWSRVKDTPMAEGKGDVFLYWINNVAPTERAAIVKELPFAITDPTVIGGLMKVVRDHQALAAKLQ